MIILKIQIARYKDLKKYVWLFIPLFVLLSVLFIYPLIRISWLSFTDYNMLKAPVFNNGANYLSILKDKTFHVAISNMTLFTLSSTIIGCFIAFVLYRASSVWGKVIRIICSIILISLSLACLAPLSLTKFLSGDSYGLLNGFLLKSNIISQPIPFLYGPFFSKPISILLTIFTMIGPLYVFFNASKASLRRKLIIAVNIGIIVNIINCMTQIMVFGFPSTEYQVHTPIMHIYDYGLVRYEMGAASALIIITLLYLLILSIMLSGIAWLISNIKLGMKPFIFTKIIGGILFAFAFITVGFDFIMKMSSLFMPMSERFLFPPSLFVRNPTLENFQYLFQNRQWIKILTALISQTIIGGFAYCLIVLPAGFAMSKFIKSKIWLRICLISGITISITSLVFATSLPPITYYVQMAFYSAVTSPLVLASLFIVANSIGKRKYLSGIFAGALIFILGSYINSFIYSLSDVSGLWAILGQNYNRDFASPFLITTIFGITAFIATLFTGIALYDSEEIQM